MEWYLIKSCNLITIKYNYSCKFKKQKNMNEEELQIGKDGEIHVCHIDNGGIYLINGEITVPKRIPGC